jgi:RNA polymerase sigma-70 factor (ECF subfamily)
VTELDVLRRRAFDVAYRMLGTRADAEDIAQETLLRVHDRHVDNAEAYATTVATRLALDQLRSARVRREVYPGPWLPEPIIEGTDPVEIADSVSYALLVVLETLTPDERAAFLLHDVFGFAYDEIGRTLGRSEPACRQLVSRARRHLGDRRPRLVDPTEHRDLLERFLAASGSGDVDALLAVLAPDAVLLSDGGPDVRAARRPIVGAERVARFLATIARRFSGLPLTRRVAVINGELGCLVEAEGQVVMAGMIDVVDGRIVAIHNVLNPEKLRPGDESSGAPTSDRA